MSCLLVGKHRKPFRRLFTFDITTRRYLPVEDVSRECEMDDKWKKRRERERTGGHHPLAGTCKATDSGCCGKYSLGHLAGILDLRQFPPVVTSKQTNNSINKLIKRVSHFVRGV